MKSLRAFSFIEILVVLSLLGIVMLIAIPNTRDFLLRTQDDILREKLMRLLERAQQESHLRHLPITLCHSRDRRTCEGEWSDGMLLFVDETEDGVVHERDQIIAYLDVSITSSGRLHMRSYPYYRQSLLFKANEMEAGDDASFWYCHGDTKKPAWVVQLSKSGRVRVGDGSGFTCIHQID